MQEVLQEVLAVEHAVEAGVPAVGPMREHQPEEEEGEGIKKDRSEGSSSTSELVLQQVFALQLAMPTGPRFWLLGQSIWVARWGLPTSSKAQGKVPAMQVVPPPPETDE